ncbi:15632_t:CDS:2 [Racocetra fulgida]|uniref:15632_t:CDS:1 n=1 Tax=Racocetra fulgida TaxID=60492 RepID=A0A9N9B043_9GLOM|nr:15632_t:CDS:2 [Racocetra fulgida]
MDNFLKDKKVSCNADNDCAEKICNNGTCVSFGFRPSNDSCIVDLACDSAICRILSDGRGQCDDSDNRPFNVSCIADKACISGACGSSGDRTVCTRALGEQYSDNRTPEQPCSVDNACSPSGRCDTISGRCAKYNGTSCNNDNDCVSLVCGQTTHVCQDKDDRNKGDLCLISKACSPNGNGTCYEKSSNCIQDAPDSCGDFDPTSIGKCVLRYATPCDKDADCLSGVCGQTTHVCTRALGEQCNDDSECSENICGENSKTCIDSDNRTPEQPCSVDNACSPSGRCDTISGRCAKYNGTSCNNDNDCVSLVCGQTTHVCQDKDDRNKGDLCLISKACGPNGNGTCYEKSSNCVQDAPDSCGDFDPTSIGKCVLRNATPCDKDADCLSGVCGQTTHVCQDPDDRERGRFLRI